MYHFSTFFLLIIDCRLICGLFKEAVKNKKALSAYGI
jgi:hypothetical protein